MRANPSTLRPKLTDAVARALRPGETRWDHVQRGLGVRRVGDAAPVYFIRYRLRDGTGVQRLQTLGPVGTLKLNGTRERPGARDIVLKILGRVADGHDPLGAKREKRKAERAAKAKTVAATVKRYLADRRRRGQRSADAVEAVFRRHVVPALGRERVDAVTRSAVADMLANVRDTAGPAAAAKALAVTRAMFGWIAERDDGFRSPLGPRMASALGLRATARERALSDAEIAALWRMTDPTAAPLPAKPHTPKAAKDCPASPVFNGLVRFLLLTAARRSEAAGLRWSEIEGATWDKAARCCWRWSDDAVWTIPAERSKTGKPHAVPLSDAARATLDALSRRDDGARPPDHAFTTDPWEIAGAPPFSGFSKAKVALDAVMLAELRRAAAEAGNDPTKAKLEPWTIHDLRRTARSLMSRAGVSPDVGERVLGHAIPGVRGVYDRHDFVDQKRAALDALARVIKGIVEPRENVVAFPAAGAAR